MRRVVRLRQCPGAAGAQALDVALERPAVEFDDLFERPQGQRHAADRPAHLNITMFSAIESPTPHCFAAEASINRCLDTVAERHRFEYPPTKDRHTLMPHEAAHSCTGIS